MPEIVTIVWGAIASVGMTWAAIYVLLEMQRHPQQEKEDR